MPEDKNPSDRSLFIWLCAVILFASVAASTIAIMSRMNVFYLDDSGAIPLIPETSAVETTVLPVTTAPVTTAPPVQDQPAPPSDTEAETAENETELLPADTVDVPVDTLPEAKPGFEVSDEQTVWTTNTQVEIFRTYYENGERVITVQSSDGDKLIAPGTENSYTFKLSNTGNVALDYTVEVDAYFEPADIFIPITGRLTRYDGKNVVGPSGEFVDVPTLDTAEDSATLSAGRYTYYTLDWLWPFESGDDGLDTMLGNLAVEQDLTFTIVIKTTAKTSADQGGSDGGILPPQTGDSVNFALIIAIGAISAAVMLVLIFIGKRDRRERA